PKSALNVKPSVACPDCLLTTGNTAEPKYRRVTVEVPPPAGGTMNHDLVRPVRSHMSSWFALRSSTRQAANAPNSPKASSFACASVDGLEANQASNCLSSLKSAVV